MSTQLQRCPLPHFLHPRSPENVEGARTASLGSTRGRSQVPVRALPPKAHGYPLVGSLPHLVKHGLNFLVEARAQYGDIYTLDLGLTKVVALNHPRQAYHVLVERAQNYAKGGPLWDHARSFLGNGLPVSEGSFWLRQRRLIQPQFHRDRLAALTEVMVQAIDEELAAWDAIAAAGQPMNMTQELARITMKVIARTMFGTGLGREQMDRVSAEMAYMLKYAIRAILAHGLPEWVPIPGRRRFHEAMRTVDQVLYELIDRRRRESSSPHDLLSLLLKMVDAETGECMTPSQLRDEAMSIFLAGYETTATALAWTFHFLLQRPALARELEEEVDSLGGRTPGFEELSRLPRTLQVQQEAMRLYPPAYWLPRLSLEEDEIDGFRIPARTVVAPIIYAIHRHPEIWTEPERFDPDRFSPECSANRPALAWLPFGAGQRLCIGKGFALMEGQLILARAAQRYRFEPVPGRVDLPEIATVLRPRGGIWVRLTRRVPPCQSQGPASA